MANPISNLGTVPTLTVGGYVFVDLTTLIHLVMGVGGNPYSTFRLQNGTAGYPVAALKTLKTKAIKHVAISAATAIQIGYGDTDVGFNAGSAPTTPVYRGGAALSTIAVTYAASVGVDREAPLDFSVPAGKYLFSETIAGCIASVFGYEV